MRISLDQLRPHPLNANVMPAALFAKLKAHLAESDRYPPLIARPYADAYQLLDGHHRCRALRELGRTEAECLVWECDDAEALALLATLNRLQGDDDPIKRAQLLEHLSSLRPLDDLAERLPETLAKLKAKIKLAAPVSLPPRAPIDPAEQPVAVHFFLLPDQRKRLLARLRQIDGSREDALMRLVDA